MRRIHYVVKPFAPCILLAASALVSIYSASAATPDLQHQIAALTSSTSLDRDGMQPWHMHLSFQLYDLKGSPQETGTVEEWWAAPDRARVVITSPSFSETLPGSRVTHGREAYLVHLLLNEVVHPLTEPKQLDQYTPSTISRNFGQKSLTCTTLALKDGRGHAATQYCTDPATSALRMLLYDEGVRSHALNDLSTFANTQIAKVHTIAYVGQIAIQGRIDSLEPFDPAHSDLALGPIAPPEDASITPPHVLSAKPPMYPSGARTFEKPGLVVLHARILTNGELSPLDVIATSGAGFTDASTDAVSRWGYTPMTRNGARAECDETITVVFTPEGKDLENPEVHIFTDMLPY